MEVPARSQIRVGNIVSIETKDNQGSGRLIEGTVAEILTSSDIHPYGIKVRLQNGQVGRVKTVAEKQANTLDIFEDLKKKTIPHTEDATNEFKEYYQYDEKISSWDHMDVDSKNKAIDGTKQAVQNRAMEAIAGFANSQTGGFLYLGINSRGEVKGLEKDFKLGGFTDYADDFANHIYDGLKNHLQDRVFITSNIRIKFREIDGKTICIIQVRPADRPVFLHAGKEKKFLLRGPAPRTEHLDPEEQAEYIKKRFG